MNSLEILTGDARTQAAAWADSAAATADPGLAEELLSQLVAGEQVRRLLPTGYSQNLVAQTATRLLLIERTWRGPRTRTLRLPVQTATGRGADEKWKLWLFGAGFTTVTVKGAGAGTLTTLVGALTPGQVSLDLRDTSQGPAAGLPAGVAVDAQAAVALSWREAEEVAARHMRGLGFTAAAVTAGGPDSGIDVHAGKAVAQVKHQSAAVTRPTLQRLRGAAPPGARMLFYASGGYTRAAIDWAEQHQMALFTFTGTGKVSATNDAARALEASAATDPVSRWVARSDIGRDARRAAAADRTSQRLKALRRQLAAQRRRAPSSRTKAMARRERTAEEHIDKATRDLARAQNLARPGHERDRAQRAADKHVNAAASALRVKWR